MGIKSNSKAYTAAKSALNLEHISSTKVPYSDSKPAIRSYTNRRWHSRWDQQEHNKLKVIQPSLGYWPVSEHSRRDAVTLRRCRIGHTHLTHSYLLKGEEPPQCVPCQCPLTVKHILLECVDTELIRERFYSTNSLQYLFNHVGGSAVLEFLKEINICHLL